MIIYCPYRQLRLGSLFNYKLLRGYFWRFQAKVALCWSLLPKNGRLEILGFIRTSRFIGTKSWQHSYFHSLRVANFLKRRSF